MSSVFSSGKIKLLINVFFTVLFVVVLSNVIRNFFEFQKLKNSADDKLMESWRNINDKLGLIKGYDEDQSDTKAIKYDEIPNIKERIAHKIANMINLVKENDNDNIKRLPTIPTSTLPELSKLEFNIGLDDVNNVNNKFNNEYNFREVFTRNVLNSIANINNRYNSSLPHNISNNVTIVSTGLMVSDFKSERPIGITIQSDDGKSDVIKLTNLLTDKLSNGLSHEIITNIIKLENINSSITTYNNAIIIDEPLFSLYVLKKYGINKEAENFLNSVNNNFFNNIKDHLQYNNNTINEYDYKSDYYDIVKSNNNPFVIINDGTCTSELALAVFNLGSIPVYCGTEDFAAYFNDNCYVNGKQFNSKQELLEYLKLNRSSIIDKAREAESIYSSTVYNIAPICFYGKFYREYYNKIKLIGKTEYIDFIKPVSLIDYKLNVRICFEDNKYSDKLKKILIDMCVNLGLLAENYIHNYDNDLCDTFIPSENEVIIWFGNDRNKSNAIEPMKIECINRRAKKELLLCYENVCGGTGAPMSISLECVGKFTISKNDYNTTINNPELITHVVNWM